MQVSTCMGDNFQKLEQTVSLSLSLFSPHFPHHQVHITRVVVITHTDTDSETHTHIHTQHKQGPYYYWFGSLHTHIYTHTHACTDVHTRADIYMHTPAYTHTMYAHIPTQAHTQPHLTKYSAVLSTKFDYVVKQHDTHEQWCPVRIALWRDWEGTPNWPTTLLTKWPMN